MKILIATMGHFHDRPTGSARITLDEAAELRRGGEDVWVLAPGAFSLPEHEVREGIHLLRYVPAKVTPWNPSRCVVHQKAAALVLSHHLPQVDAVHGHVPLPYLAALDFYGSGVDSFYTVHSPARMEMAIEWRSSSFLRKATAPLGLAMIQKIEAECLLRSRAITALSRYTIDCIAKVHGAALTSKVRMVPGWVDTSRFVPIENRYRTKAALGWPMDRPVFFTLRRLVARMGLDRLLSAASLLLEQNLRFHIMIGGTGPLRASLEEQARELGVENSITFLGRIPEDELPLAYGACDAFVLPTAELECFGLIALEALSAGRPVLATPIGAIPELVQEFEPSWLARSAEAPDIARLLRDYLAGRLSLHAPGELHMQVRARYGRDRMVRELIEATVLTANVAHVH